ncbi:sacsin N-terminal ATP-binding-like domain-containing protein [Sphingobacterium siyangense]|uniref:sacsin N-terminal ATP-binding-like domain-containing protein n=1 Tax=Sphingobacterium siyangense TaxID=459529 RepID=UPI0031F98301
MDADQAITMSNLLDTVSIDIYSESQRFVFELIQNADDAAKDTNNEVHFDFFQNSLIVSHNGNPFSENDIKALTGAGSSTKKEDITKTGYKGIGFKSVFGKSERVSIFSDGFQFRFDRSHFKTTLPWQIIPIWTETGELQKEVQETVQKNKYAVSTIIEIDGIEQLETDLDELLHNGQILLFLRRVSKVSVSKNGKLLYLIEKKILNREAHFSQVILFKDDQEISRWITKTYGDIAVPEKTKQELKKDEKTPRKLRDAEMTEISFAAKIEDSKITALKDGESLIFTYLPTKVNDFRFPFLVNGSFLTNAARERIHEDKVWNHWLFELTAEKILDWLVELSSTQYRFQILRLLPNNFYSEESVLKKSFNRSFSKESSSKNFIITQNEKVQKASEVVLDKTALSSQKFIDQKSITEYLRTEKQLVFSEDCFVHSNVEEANKLKAIGVHTFELENFGDFFASRSFTDRHKVPDNFSLIKFFKQKSDDDKSGIWFQNLKTLPFIYDEKGKLYNPSNGICFPTGLSSTELGDIPVIHPDIFEKIESEKLIYDWLKVVGVKEPSEVAYVTNVIIPGIRQGNFINESNFLQITRYLFRLFKENLLDEEMLECLREIKLKTKDSQQTFKSAQLCYLSNRYNPQIKIEGVIKEVTLVSEEYLNSGSSELEWSLFFKAIKVKDRVEIETINQNNALGTLRELTDTNWVDECQTVARKKNGFGYGEHNVINSVKLPSFINLISSNIEYSKLFWKSIITRPTHLQELSENASYKYGTGNGHNRFAASVTNYFPWYIKNRVCIPTSTKQILNPSDVYINTKEIKDIAGTYLPVFDFDEPITEDWKNLLRFKDKLELLDYLSVLSKIVEEAEEKEEKETKFTAPLRRIGLIYNKLAAILPDMTDQEKQLITDWASENKLLSINGNFEPAKEIKWITVEGFSTESEKLKVIRLPENANKHLDSFKQIISLFQVQTIDEFIPVFDKPLSDTSLKDRLESILPYYLALIEKKKMDESLGEFDRIYHLLDATEFYTASEIKLSFNFQSETFDGPSLTVYKEENKFYFKGKWKSERTLLSLIKELSSFLGVFGLNEELRFLLLETETSEIREWLSEQGINVLKLSPPRSFMKKIPEVLQADQFDEDLIDNDFEKESDDNSEDHAVQERFEPIVNSTSFDIADILAKRKTFSSESMKAAASYSHIQSEEVREDVGRWCEEFVNDYLIKSNDGISEVLWMNEDAESGKPFDFKIVQNGKEHFIDVKGTPSAVKDVVYLSPNEWKFMLEKKEDYSIYRVYNAGKDARIEIIENPADLLQRGIIFPNPITLQV